MIVADLLMVMACLDDAENKLECAKNYAKDAGVIQVWVKGEIEEVWQLKNKIKAQHAEIQFPRGNYPKSAAVDTDKKTIAELIEGQTGQRPDKN